MEYEKSYGQRQDFCPALGFQEAKVSVPVEIKPFAEVGRVKFECVGKPVIHRGTKECKGKERETCKFTISQKIRVEVPVAFSAKTEIGPAMIDCKCGERQEDYIAGECKGPDCLGMIG